MTAAEQHTEHVTAWHALMDAHRRLALAVREEAHPLELRTRLAAVAGAERRLAATARAMPVARRHRARREAALTTVGAA